MKRQYTEKIPAQEIKHKLIVCDNPNCGIVIEDNGELLEEYWQVGFNGKLLDLCSEKCIEWAKKKVLKP